MTETPATRSQPAPQQPDPLDILIDRVAEAVVQKLEERRKIDMIAQAVLQRIRWGTPGQDPTDGPECGPSIEEGQP
jgi:hypothetical protein